ncbi:MAG: hypothetical protein JJU21_10735 [Salinarimonas sp.]|nr:hypothetical protein [Salinarimonas sp.]
MQPIQFLRIPMPVVALGVSLALIAYAMRADLYAGPGIVTTLLAMAAVFVAAKSVAQPLRRDWRDMAALGIAIAVAPLVLSPFIAFPLTAYLVHLICGILIGLRARFELHGDNR